ncbi:MAG: rhodanese-like domain-containing protein [Desulfatiglans sp.]|nr:rhodanese-like domain-containing protein [Thermodesulfobacteriota bacterium]MEE4354776.1 rhodanese-like domain-containing protein [Desulfatiglans sp.]
MDHFRFHRKRLQTGALCACLVSWIFFIPFYQPVYAAEPLTDAAKIRIIDEMYKDYKRDFPDVEDFSAREVLKMIARGRVILVDIRKRREQAVSMISGAITEKKFRKNPSEYSDYIVIGYCTIGSRSGKLARKYRKKGIPLFNMRGGILAWLHAGGTVHKGGTPVKRVHVYGKKWDLAPNGITSLW